MLDSSLTDILRTLSIKEWTEFEKFCGSTFHNGGRDLTPLLRLLKRFRNEFDSDRLSREFLYGKLYPGRPYRKSVMESSLSRLAALAEEFLIQLGIKQNQFFIKERLLLSEIAERGLRKRGDKTVRMIEKKLKDRKEHPFDFTAKKEVHMGLATYYSTLNLRQKHVEQLEKTKRYIIYSFISELAYFESAKLSGLSFSNQDPGKSYEKQLVELIDLEGPTELARKYDKTDFGFLNLYYLMKKAVEDSHDESNYFAFKESAYGLLGRMDDTMKRFVYNTLGALSSYYMVTGRKGFKKEAFEIRKKAVEEGLYSFSDSGIPKVSEFRSTFIDALNERDFDWAEEFCNKFIELVNPDEREDLRNYYTSRLAYERNDLDTALKLVSKVNINQLVFKLDTRNLISKIYFDTGSYDSLLSLLDSYTKLTGRPGVRSSAIQIRHRKYAGYLKRLVLLKERRADPAKFAELKNRMAGDNFTSKTWLLERTEKEQRRT